MKAIKKNMKNKNFKTRKILMKSFAPPSNSNPIKIQNSRSRETHSTSEAPIKSQMGFLGHRCSV